MEKYEKWTLTVKKKKYLCTSEKTVHTESYVYWTVHHCDI